MSLFTTFVAFCILSRALPCWVAGWFPTFRTYFMFPPALHCFLGVWIAPCQLLGIVFMRFPTLEVHHIHRCLASTHVTSQTILFLFYCLLLSSYCDGTGEFLLGWFLRFKGASLTSWAQGSCCLRNSKYYIQFIVTCFNVTGWTVQYFLFPNYLLLWHCYIFKK